VGFVPSKEIKWSEGDYAALPKESLDIFVREMVSSLDKNAVELSIIRPKAQLPNAVRYLLSCVRRGLHAVLVGRLFQMRRLFTQVAPQDCDPNPCCASGGRSRSIRGRSGSIRGRSGSIRSRSGSIRGRSGSIRGRSGSIRGTSGLARWWVR
jgi:hypothetical protein